MFSIHSKLCLSMLILGLSFSSLSAAEAAPESTSPAVKTLTPPPPAPPVLKPYEDPYRDGLYSTIVTMIQLGGPEPKKQKEFKLQIPKAKAKVLVKAIIQDQPAPLVVVLVGVDGKAADPLGLYWPYVLDKYAKYNVLWFDSTFRPGYADTTRFGVTGNFPAEAEQASQLIAEFLKLPDVKGKITQIGVLGYSMGGTQAMLMGQMAADKKLPFELAGAVAFSPPVSLKRTAELLDEFYNKDRWKYTMADMAKTFMTHTPIAPGGKIPFEPDFMRAAIGFLVRDEFTQIVERNDSIFRLKLIPDEDADGAAVNRVSMAEAWGFVRFMEKMSFPYWKQKGAVKTVDDLWDGCTLSHILKNNPPNTHAVIAADDPLNSPEDLDALQKSVDPKILTVLPNGGHLGFMGSYWSFYQVKQMFGDK